MTKSHFSQAEIKQLPERHLAVVRETVDVSSIRALYDRAFPALFAALSRHQIAPIAAPMGIIHGIPGDTLDLSVAIPVEEPFDGDGEVTAESLPAATVATMLLFGGYDRLTAAYGHLYGWLAENGLEAGDIAWEQYLSEPDSLGDPEANETLIGVHLK